MDKTIFNHSSGEKLAYGIADFLKKWGMWREVQIFTGGRCYFDERDEVKVRSEKHPEEYTLETPTGWNPAEHDSYEEWLEMNQYCELESYHLSIIRIRINEEGFTMMDNESKSNLSNEELIALIRKGDDSTWKQLIENNKVLIEKHTMTKSQLLNCLQVYRMGKHRNSVKPEKDNTLIPAINKIIEELDPLEYTGDNDREYRIKYSGYEEDRLLENMRKEKGSAKKRKPITDLYYEHPFSYRELDKLIELIAFSDSLSEEENWI